MSRKVKNNYIKPMKDARWNHCTLSAADLAAILRTLRSEAAHCFDNDDDYAVIVSRFTKELGLDSEEFEAFAKVAEVAEDAHIAKMCMSVEVEDGQLVPCRSEATRWYEDPSYPDKTVYTCLDHEAVEVAEENGWSIENSIGEKVELSVYLCRPQCETCD